MTDLSIQFLLFQALIFFGAAYVIGHSVISRPFREWLARTRVGSFFVTLIECPSCISFHFGWLAVALQWSPFFPPRNFVFALEYACFFAATSFLLGRATGIISAPQHYFSHPFSPTVEERHITEVTSETEK